MSSEEVKHPEIQHLHRRANVLYWSCFFVGCGALTPWSTQLSAVDYFKHIYPHRDAMRWIPVFYLPPSILVALLNSFMAPKKLGHDRVTIGFLVTGLALFVVPIIDGLMIHGDEGTDTTFALLLAAVAIIGAADGVVDAAFSGLAAYLPFDYYQAYIRGTGLSAVTSVTIRIVTKAVFTESRNSLRLSACIFYLASSLICWSCLIVHRWIVVPHPIWNEDLRADEGQSLLQDSPRDNHGPRSVWTRIAESQWLKTGKKIKLASLCMFLNMFTQCAIFPGILTDIEYEALGSWYEVLLVLLNSLASFLIRWLPATWIAKKKGQVFPLVLARCLLIPLAFLAVHYFSYPPVIATIIAILGASRGYLLLGSFGMGQLDLEGRADSLVGGSLLSFYILFGLCIGSFAALAWMLFD